MDIRLTRGVLPQAGYIEYRDQSSPKNHIRVPSCSVLRDRATARRRRRSRPIQFHESMSTYRNELATGQDAPDMHVAGSESSLDADPC